MKNNLKYALICTILAGGGFFTSCNKDQPTVKETYVIDDNYKNLDQQIAQFRTSMLDTRKTGTVMELNEAVWMMEASFNYYHGFTGEDYLTTQTDTTIIPIAYSGFDDVPSSELSSLFKQVNNAIVASYENYPAENKKPFIYDLELQATTSGSMLLVITTNGTVNTEKTVVIGTETPFGSTDYWYPGLLTGGIGTIPGKCGPYVGQKIGVSAANFELERAARTYIRGAIGGFHYVDIETIPGQITPNYYENLLFQGPGNYCLNPTEMNYFFNGMDYIINDIHSIYGISSDKQFVSLQVYVGVIPGAKSSTYYHALKDIKFGKREYYTMPPIEPSFPSNL